MLKKKSGKIEQERELRFFGLFDGSKLKKLAIFPFYYNCYKSSC